jgi:hypothetical protein
MAAKVPSGQAAKLGGRLAAEEAKEFRDTGK